jgi:hypothetical protein
MVAKRMQVGFSQRIQLPWLEYTAQLVVAGRDRKDVSAALQDYLSDKLSVGNQPARGNREKAITILLKIWFDPAPRTARMRDEGLDLLKRLPANQHVALHWGLSMAAYPFFAEVAAVLGKLLRLQDTLGTVQIQRRIREQLGERDTVARAARRIYRSYIDWGVIKETETKGVYRKGTITRLPDTDLSAWLLRCVMLSSPAEWIPVTSLSSHASIFPFELNPSGFDSLRGHEQIEIMRHGLDQEMVRFINTPKKWVV